MRTDGIPTAEDEIDAMLAAIADLQARVTDLERHIGQGPPVYGGPEPPVLTAPLPPVEVLCRNGKPSTIDPEACDTQGRIE